MTYVLDTSVIIPLFFEEDRSLAVQVFVQRTAGDVAVSIWSSVELESVLRRQAHQGAITVDTAHTIRSAYSDLCDGPWRTLPLNDRTALRAARLVRGAAPLAPADALHLATADLGGATIVTADRRLYRAAEANSVPAVNIE